MRDYSQSQGWVGRALKVTPGASQTRSKQPARYPLGAHPAALTHGLGSRVWDVDGHDYIDWSMSLAAVTLGHGYPPVVAAVERQLQDGILFSLPHPLEAEVAERLCAMIPCAQQVRFVKTGSEAFEALLRVARCATGRDVIVTVGAGYHSWHSAFSAVKLHHPGVPKAYEALIDSFEYNDLESLDAALSRHVGNVAAVILEPTLLIPPAPGFLEDARRLAHQAGALFVLDEVVTGFRWALAGGQEYFGVVPDLAIFGKGMTGIGMPLACLAGPRDLMKHAEWISGTFGGETLSLAACKATLDVYEKEPVIDTMWDRGNAFRKGLSVAIINHGLPAKMEGYGVHPKLTFTHDDAEVNRLLMSVALQELAERGVLIHPGGFNSSYAHTEEDVADSLAAADAALAACSEGLDKNSLRVRLRGEPIQVGMEVRR